MGYTTEFDGSIAVEPPLSAEEVSYINKFAASRRMDRKNGPYFVDGVEDYGFGSNEADADIIDPNRPDPSQPGLWCQWVASDDGKTIAWDYGEKFYEAEAWMEYYMEHFIGSNPKAQKDLPFLTGHTCNGEIEANGEESGDHWILIVKDNSVTTKTGKIVYG